MYGVNATMLPRLSAGTLHTKNVASLGGDAPDRQCTAISPRTPLPGYNALPPLCSSINEGGVTLLENLKKQKEKVTGTESS